MMLKEFASTIKKIHVINKFSFFMQEKTPGRIIFRILYELVLCQRCGWDVVKNAAAKEASG